MKRMNKGFYESVANKIRKGYNIIISNDLWYGDTEIDGNLYYIERPSYDMAGHYGFRVKAYGNGCEIVASGEVSAQYVENKVIRFYAGEAILYSEAL